MAEEQKQIEPLVTVPMDLVGVVNIDASDLASRLSGNQLLDLIGQIDEEKGSYYFTEVMFRMIRDMRDGMLDERPELATMSDKELNSLFLKEENEQAVAE